MNRNNGLNMRNFIDILANSISLIEGDEAVNIRDLFVEESQIKSNYEVEDPITHKKSYEYNTEDINDESISGLESMIRYIKSHSKSINKNIQNYEDTTNIIVKKDNHISNNYLLNNETSINNKSVIYHLIKNHYSHYSGEDIFNLNIKNNHKVINNFNNEDTVNFNIKKHNNTTINNYENKTVHNISHEDNVIYNTIVNNYKNIIINLINNEDTVNFNIKKHNNTTVNNYENKTVHNISHEDNVNYNTTVNNSNKITNMINNEDAVNINIKKQNNTQKLIQLIMRIPLILTLKNITIPL